MSENEVPGWEAIDYLWNFDFGKMSDMMTEDPCTDFKPSVEYLWWCYRMFKREIGLAMPNEEIPMTCRQAPKDVGADKVIEVLCALWHEDWDAIKFLSEDLGSKLDLELFVILVNKNYLEWIDHYEEDDDEDDEDGPTLKDLYGKDLDVRELKIRCMCFSAYFVVNAERGRGWRFCRIC
jgi:hypothetical protein